MANRLKVFANPTFANFKLAGITALMLFASTELSALGLGTLEVQSNLDEPLRGVIELRTSSGDDINSVRASIASRADFENLGIDYPSYLRDISLLVERDGSSMILRVNSADVIIKEPFIHFLVRVDWSGGSFLREYTALIDPPVYAAEAPTLLAEPKLVGTDQSYDTGTIDSYDIDAVDESEIVESEISDPEPIYGEEPVANEEPVDYEEPAVAEPIYDDTPTSTDSDEYYEPEAVSDVVTEDSSSQESDATPITQATDAQYGPVANGESLSVIAAELQRQFPDLSIYQIMQVMFEENQSAFIGGNINGLIMGSVLNIGDLNVIRAVDVAQSKIFFRNQVRAWDPSLLIARESDAVKVGQDEYSFDSDSFSSDSDDDSAFSGSEAEDNFQVGASGTTDSFVSDGAGDTNAGEVIALRQQITELQTSLASGSIENQDLTERISILEGQLADMNRLMNLSIEDADLANVEATLAAQNNADADLSADASGDEFFDVAELEDPNAAETVVDSEFVDGLLDEAGAGGASGDLDSDQLNDGVVEAINDVDAASAELATPVAVTPTSVAVKTVPIKSEPGFMQKVSNFLFADGMWRILAGIGALLVGGIVLLIIRRRRADEEFEVSMMSIGTNSQSIDDPSSVSASMSASVSQPSTDKGDEEGPDKETSFLTVYSDSDAVVQADEVDPIAEADVYIAYGRDEQAEEVLLDGVTGNPERYDIKYKLLGLYHKNQNAEGFERVAEELYSQRQQLTAEIWQDVCKMGKEVAADNPLFDLSSDDFAAASLVDENAPQSPVEQHQEETQAAAQDITSADQDAIEEISVTVDNVEYQIDEIDDPSEAIGNALDSDDDDSIQLINFDDGRSEISELDQVEIDALDLDGGDEDSLVAVDASDSGDVTRDSVEIDLNDELEIDSVEFGSSPTLVEQSFDSDDFEERSLQDVQEVSDMEIDADYDEARTQYELAKVFVDLGDEDGARKILNDIVDNTENSVEVLTDANALLASIT